MDSQLSEGAAAASRRIAPPRHSADAQGLPLIPDYDLIRRVGQGAYGEVWLVRSKATGALRAAKLVWRRRFEEARPFEREFEGIQRFERISRQHPSQLALFHIGRNDAAGYFYYVMELADDAGADTGGPMLDAGCQLTNMAAKASPIAQHPVSSIEPAASYVPDSLREELRCHGRLPAERAIDIGLALASALAHLHKHGLVHRDVKPSNIIFVQGTPKLADIGLVTDVGDSQSLVGTEGYLPPEGPGTPQADIFALGKVLYEAVTGQDRRCFPDLPSDLKGWLDCQAVLELNEILLRACAADPFRRYLSAERVYADLAILKSGQSVRRLRTMERRLALFSRVGVVIGLCALMSLGILYETNHRREIAARSVARLHLANGTRLLDEGDLFGSLLSLTEALRLDAGNVSREECHRIRIASVLRDCPKLVGLFAHTNAPINQAAFSPDSRRLVTCSDDHTARVWDLATGAQELCLQHPGMVFGAAFSPDGEQIATTSSNHVFLWHAKTGEARRLAPIRHREHFTGPYPRFSPHGERLVTLVDARTLRIWDARTGEVLGQPMQHDQEVWSFSFNPQGNRILTLSGEKVARLWDGSTGEAVRAFGPAGSILSAEFSPDGRLLAATGNDHRVRLWDANSGKLIGEPLANRATADSVEFSPEGGRLAVACRDRTVRLWDTTTGTELLGPLQHNRLLFHAGFSPDGRRLVTCSQGNRVRLWDADTGAALPPVFIHNTPRGPVAFSPDGHLMLTVRRDLTLDREEVALVWSLTRPEPAPLAIRPSASFRPTALSNDHRLKSIINGDRIRIIDSRSGNPVAQPLVQGSPFRQACFGYDPALLLTENGDGYGRVWDTTAGEPLTPQWKVRYDPNAHEFVKRDLPKDERPVEDLVKLAQLLSGYRVDETGGFRPLERSTLMQDWDLLKRKYPATFTDSAAEVLAWHEHEATASEQAWNWWAARFHLDFLLAAKPEQQPWKERRAYAEQALALASAKAPGYLEQRRMMPPRNPLAPARLVDLSDYYNASKQVGLELLNGFQALDGLPSGLQTLAGTTFDVRGVVRLSGMNRGAHTNDWPEQVRNIPMNQRCRRVHFLHATGGRPPDGDGAPVFSYVVHYADQQTQRIRMVYGRDVRSWQTSSHEPLGADASFPVWIGPRPQAFSDGDMSLRVFKSTWHNPRPQVEITKLDFITDGSGATPLLMAITIDKEPELPGQHLSRAL